MIARTAVWGGAMLVAALASPAAAPAQDELIQLVVGLLGEEDKDLRALAFEQIRTQVPGEAATLRFAELLPKFPPATQVGLLSALADRGDAVAAPAVRNLLDGGQDQTQTVKVAAIAALGALGGAGDCGLLAKFLASTSKPQQEAARASLVRLQGESVAEAIAAEMKGSPAPLRVALIEILAARRAGDAVGHLLTAAVDGDSAVRGAAMAALGQLAGPEHVAGMVEGVLKAERGRERDAAERAVMFVCHRIDDPRERAAPLLAAMQGRKEHERMILLTTLGRVGGPAALEALEAARSDPDPAMHDAGLRAICNWPDASIASRLLLLARTEEHPEHRRMALRALIRVAPFPDERSDGRRLDLLRTAMAMCQEDADRLLALDRAKAVRTVQTLRFVMPYLDQPPLAQQACLTVVELAHHSGLREPNKAEFDHALDKVIEVSKDAIVIDRAQRYKKGQTWVRPKAS